MAYSIGIDTGGTYTDAVIYDGETGRVLAQGKARTTREDLSLGIGAALDALPRDMLAKARLVALSTTLATNACVEGQGGRAKLVMMGSSQKTLRWVGADKKYGLNYDDVLCIDTHGSFDGTVVDHPDWPAIMDAEDGFLSQAEALSVVELNAMHNGGVCEREARDALKSRYDVPLVMASELVSGLNVMERGATALLNARLLPVVDRFMKAVGQALARRGLTAPRVIVRSDGSLMSESLALSRPVETILSGPAASVIGSRTLGGCADALIVDMGGTTTDLSILRRGAPLMTGGIRIGGWRTQIRGVFIDTLGLGGDTRVLMADKTLSLDTRRVEPICVAASRWPRVKDALRELLTQSRPHTRPLHEFLYLVREPDRPELYTEAERGIIDALRGGPQMLGGDALNTYRLDSERLEREGVVMRCGLTPTDIMHIRGDYAEFDGEASVLTARYFLRVLPDEEDTPDGLISFCDKVYELVRRRLFQNIARVLIESTYPQLCAGGIGEMLTELIDRKWETRDDPDDDSFFSLRLDARAALVGIGAPIHLFLPEVARALGMRCVIPDHSDVANAVGAAAADVGAYAEVVIRSGVSADGEYGCTVHAADRILRFEEYDQALEAAKEAAAELAMSEARRRGATGELTVRTDVVERRAQDRYGAAVDLGTTVIAEARGAMGD